MKKILTTIVFILIGCAGPSRQIQTELIPPQGPPGDMALQRLAGALSIPTVSWSDTAATEAEAFLTFHRFLVEHFPRVHRNLNRETINQFSLLYTWSGRRSDLPPLLLMAHSDVVPADNSDQSRWDHDPFQGKIVNDVLFGRGAVDNKSALLGILEAVEYLLGQGYQPERTILLAFGHDEEISGHAGAARIADVLKQRQITPWLILDEGGAIVTEGVPGISAPVALVGIAEKGYVSLELSATGTGGHSSMPPPETAITVLSKAVAAVSDHPMPGSLEGPIREMLITLAPESHFPFNLLFSNLWAFGGIIEGQLAASPKSNALIRTTTAPTMFHAGVKDNQLPQKATAVINFRLKPGDTTADVIRHVEKVIDNPDVSVKPVGTFQNEPSVVSNYHSPQYDAIATSIRRTFPDVIVSPYLTVGGTDTKYYAGMSDQIYRFLPLQFAPGQLDGMHGINEYITKENYAQLIGFYVQLIRNVTENAN
ncbi:MAG: M20 family peptidase [Fidelibacterota bacterium]